MNLRGPVLTLLAVVVLAAVLLLVNMRTATEAATQVTIPPAITQEPVATQAPADAQAPVDAQVPVGTPESGSAVAADQIAYAGRTSGNEATIAIVVQGDQVAAYLCDGGQVEAWLEGTITDGQLDLQGSDAASATGAVSGDAVFGTVVFGAGVFDAGQVQGTQWPFAAQQAESPAGLYEGRGTVDGAPARVGWIVLPDGSQTGIAKIGDTTRPAPALDPDQLTGVEVDGSTIVPQPVTGRDPVLGPPS